MPTALPHLSPFLLLSTSFCLLPSQTADFFDPTNEEGVAARWECARACMEDLLSWMDSGGQVNITLLLVIRA